LTSSYAKLIENYHTLLSDYEEEKVSREKYKKLARGQERNPFVLVLIDADGYVFEDSLVKAGAEGGTKAAVMVRAYTDLAGLSRTLFRAGLVGNEARSLSPFCSNFTRAHDLFDFVDAGDKENADNKIREMFRLFIENNQCKHIFFAAGHDTAHLNLLTPYIGRHDKITLIRASSLSPEFQNLKLGIDGLNGLFHNNSPNGLGTRRLSPIKALQPAATSHANKMPAPATTPICGYYIRGGCKYGKTCKKSHDARQPSSDMKNSASRASGFLLPHPAFHSQRQVTVYPAPTPSLPTHLTPEIRDMLPFYQETRQKQQI
jgi:hypothetical protein